MRGHVGAATASIRGLLSSARLKLDRFEALVLASGLFLVIPGLRAVWAWPWLWAVPGWFFARRVLGVRRGFLLVALTLASSIAFASLVCLPITILVGGPRPWGVFVSIAAFAIACGFGKPKDDHALPRVPWPPVFAVVLVACFIAFRIGVIITASNTALTNPDEWYLAGVVRELGAAYPPSNPIAATTLLKQPWGYWLLYALTHVASHLSVAVTLQVASIVLALAFLSALHVLVVTVSGSRSAGGFSVALALGAGELLWIEESIRPTTERLTWQVQGVTSFAVNLVNAYYDVPILIVAILALYFLASKRIVLAGVLSAIAPFFHPVHASVLFLAAGLAFAFEAGRRRLTLVHAWLLLVPVPFVVLFVLVYAHGLPSHMPFVPRLSETGVQLTRFARWAGLYVPLALAGAFRRRLHARSLLVMLFATTSALSIFTVAANYHWTADLLSVAMVVLGGVALGALVEQRRRLGGVLAFAIVMAGIAAADYPAVLTLAQRDSDRRTSDERAAGRWIKENTAPRAILAVDHRSMPAIATALALGDRRVFLGPTYQFVNTATGSEVEALAAANLASLRDPCEAQRRGVDYVLLERRGADARALARWRATGAPAYENGELSIYAAGALSACPR